MWQVQVGHVPLYLLDADVSENPSQLREITAQLYAGDSETRLQQEIVLGFGAQRLLEALELPIDLFHYNEAIRPCIPSLTSLLCAKRAIRWRKQGKSYGSVPFSPRIRRYQRGMMRLSPSSCEST